MPFESHRGATERCVCDRQAWFQPNRRLTLANGWSRIPLQDCNRPECRVCPRQSRVQPQSVECQSSRFGKRFCSR